MKHPGYPKYKESDVAWLGAVPEHWELKRLSYLALLKSGESITSEQIAEGGEYPVYGGNGLRGHFPAYTHDGVFVLIGRQGALCGNINYATGKFWASEHAVVVNPLTTFAERWLGELLFAMNLNQYSVSAAQPGLSVSQIGSLKIPVPPISEQTAIADFLDRETGRIDTLVAKKRALIGLLKEKRSALISRTVTRGLPAEVACEVGLKPHTRFKDSGIEWLGEVPEGWEVKALSRVTISIRNGTSANQVDDAEHTVPVTRIESISGGKINLEKVGQVEWTPTIESYRLKKGDILLSHINSLSMIGNCAIYDSVFPLFSGMNLLRIQPEPTVHAHWLWRVLSSDGIRKEISSRAKPAINQASVTTTQIKALQLPVPLLPEQTAIAAYLDRETTKIDRLVEKVEAAIERLREYRTALITAAVTGKIDVREGASQGGSGMTPLQDSKFARTKCARMGGTQGGTP